MTKDELIEVLAERLYRLAFDTELAWPDAMPTDQDLFRADAAEVWPLIVDFVAGWLISVGDEMQSDDEVTVDGLVDRWRESMA